MLRKLKHAIRVACDKIEELEETIQSNNHNLNIQNKRQDLKTHHEVLLRVEKYNQKI